MQTWQIDSTRQEGKLALTSVALLLESAQTASPAAGWLRLLNDVAPVDYLSIVEYVPRRTEGGASVPELVQGLSVEGIPNVTPECFAMYREGFWRDDEATRLAQHQRPAAHPITALRFRPADIPIPGWKRDIYDRVKLEDRLSFLYSPITGITFAINMYRTRRQGPFGASELARLMEIAPSLRSAHRASLTHGGSGTGCLADRLANAERRLRRHLPELSDREHAVCARIGCGLTLDGIAADLDVAPSTIATMRKRAYVKIADRGMLPGRAALARLIEKH